MARETNGPTDRQADCFTASYVEVDGANARVLRSFLALVLFVDTCKRERLISHDPCLFRVESAFKVSGGIGHRPRAARTTGTSISSPSA